METEESKDYLPVNLILPQQGFFPNDLNEYNSTIQLFYRGLTINSMDCDISFNEGQWLPNSNDKLGGIGVNIPITTNKGVYNGEADIRLLGLIDPHYSSGIDGQLHNVYRNKGDNIELYAQFPASQGGDTLIMTYSRSDDSSVYSMNGSTYFDNQGFFDDKNCRLYRDGNGDLVFKLGNKSTTSFAVKASGIINAFGKIK